MIVINRRKYLAELGKLLTFMYEEDRQEALALYEQLFDAAIDEISAGLDMSAAEISAALIGLELLRRVRKEGMKYHRIR